MTSHEFVIRRAGPADLAALEDALVWAFNWSPDRAPLAHDDVLARSDAAHYVVGWPLVGDGGVVAVPAGVGGPVGAAWWRYLPADDPGYGFVAGDVPELGIGVHPAWRGRGVGRRLLRALLAAARERGVGRISLSVERANRARSLYLDEGFQVVGGDADAETMVVDLEAGVRADGGRSSRIA